MVFCCRPQCVKREVFLKTWVLKTKLAIKGIKHCEFAKQANLAPQTVSVILNGYQKPGPLTVQKLVLGMFETGFSKREILEVLTTKKRGYG